MTDVPKVMTMNVQPGDIVVVKYHTVLSAVEQQNALALISGLFPSDVKVMVVDATADISVLRPAGAPKGVTLQ